jgi:hypothetical protein
MTSRADFSEEEWRLVLEGPTGAAMLVVTAHRGGAFDETLAIAQSYADARRDHGASELVSSIVAVKPVIQHTRFRSTDEFRDACLTHLRRGLEVVAARATTEETDDYKRLIVNLCERVARAHNEGPGREAVSGTEHDAISEIRRELGLT